MKGIKENYEGHSELYKEHASGQEKEKHASTWLEEGNVSYWLHERMYKTIAPILEVEKGANWLTVGDGRYGKDAGYILKNGGNALATDICDYLLKEGKEKEVIKEYKKENAESLSFNDREFDYVLCKESLHHFPRPFLALYEMLRVARKGVVMIEPYDYDFFDNFWEMTHKLIAILKGSTVFKHHRFEEHSYCYTISRRELEKVAAGLGLRTLAFKGHNFYYEEGVEYAPTTPDSEVFNRVKQKLAERDSQCKRKTRSYSMLIAVIFTEDPSGELQEAMKKEGFEIKTLPQNPHKT